VSWFAIQLAVLLVVAFLAGLATGYLWFVWGWKKHKLSQDHLRRLAASERAGAH
jgi:uncharacterized membrane protein YciS (DUF1049 family)